MVPTIRGDLGTEGDVNQRQAEQEGLLADRFGVVWGEIVHVVSPNLASTSRSELGDDFLGLEGKPEGCIDEHVERLIHEIPVSVHRHAASTCRMPPRQTPSRCLRPFAGLRVDHRSV